MQGVTIKLDPERLLGWQVSDDDGASAPGVKVGATKIGPTKPGALKPGFTKVGTTKLGGNNGISGTHGH